MQDRGWWCFCVLAVICLLSPIVQSQQERQVSGRHLPSAVTNGQARPLGRLPATQRMDLSIVLRLRNQSELTSLLRRLYDPSSPDYRHFLSVREFTDQFGPTAEDYQAVVNFAKAHGFTVKSLPTSRLVVSVNGTVEQVQDAFNVKMQTYQHPTENRAFFSADREPSVPSGLPVTHVSGLNNYSLPQPMLRAPRSNTEKPIDIQGSGPGGYYLGSDMRAAYYGGSTLTGNGQLVGLIQFDGYNISDVVQAFDGTATSSTSGTDNVINYTPPNSQTTYQVPIHNVLLDGATGAPGPGQSHLKS